MHSTNMKGVENCCISSCNLLSQRHFNGNLNHSFQIHFHLLYKMASAPVSFSLSIPFLEALTFLLITWFRLGLRPQPHQLPIPATTQLRKTVARLRSEILTFSLGNTTSTSSTLSPPESACQMPSGSLKLSRLWNPDHLLNHVASPGWTLQPAISMIRLLSNPNPSFSLYYIIHPLWMTSKRAFSSHILRLLQTAAENNENMLIRSVNVLCNLISWTLTEPSTIKKNLSDSSCCLHPIEPITAAPNPLPSLSPQQRTFLTLLENFVHKAIRIIGLDFHLSPFLF